MSIFTDDAPLDAKRQTALSQILASVPPAFRIPMRSQFENMVNNMSEQQLAQAVADIAAGKQAAQSGDLARVLELAHHWATDEQIKQYMPVVEQMLRVR